MATKTYADIRLRINSEDDYQKFEALKEHFGDQFDTEILRKAIRIAYETVINDEQADPATKTDSITGLGEATKNAAVSE